jgi:formylglycine-generating enzyme required for sulfatase activity
MYEWEAAAGGKEGLLYPWGNDPAPLHDLPSLGQSDVRTLLRGTDGASAYDVYRRFMVPVQQKTYESSGLLHTLDNIREFTSTMYSGDDVVITGPYLDLPSTAWDLRKVSTFGSTHYGSSLGFRCAKSAMPPLSH